MYIITCSLKLQIIKTKKKVEYKKKNYKKLKLKITKKKGKRLF